MKANELMIGDWVAFRGHPYRYTANDLATMAECEKNGVPTDTSEIPLTDEILRSNGFEKKEKGRYVCFSIEEGYSLCYNNLLKSLDAFHTTFIKGYTNSRAQLSKHIEYVHELQHAMRFLGIDKEIVL